MNTPLSKLNISARLFHLCESHNISTLGDLLGKTNNELLMIKGLGRGTFAEIQSLRDRKHLPTDEDQYKSTYILIQKERESAIKEQWVNTYDILPALNGDTSEEVLCFNGDYHLAHYDRYLGWVSTNGEIIYPSRWMKIPKP